jgi:septal ring factor EnvC (AmiA/AmiB activator)
MRSLAVFLLLLMSASAAAGADDPDEWAVFTQRLATRQEVLARQQDQAAANLREQAYFAYRLARRRERGFVSSPESRLAEAGAADLALAALGRGLAEARILIDELARVRSEQFALNLARSRQVDTASPTTSEPLRRFARPVRGAMVGEPGIRRDSPTGTELRRDGIELLARLNEPVRAVAAGVIRLVEALPEGGYAVVTQHPSGWVTVLSGMRDVAVATGEPVELGETLGLAGRNLDGAAVVTLEIWRNRRSVDPRRLVAGLR